MRRKRDVNYKKWLEATKRTEALIKKFKRIKWKSKAMRQGALDCLHQTADELEAWGKRCGWLKGGP